MWKAHPVMRLAEEARASWLKVKHDCVSVEIRDKAGERETLRRSAGRAVEMLRPRFHWPTSPRDDHCFLAAPVGRSVPPQSRLDRATPPRIPHRRAHGLQPDSHFLRVYQSEWSHSRSRITISERGGIRYENRLRKRNHQKTPEILSQIRLTSTLRNRKIEIWFQTIRDRKAPEVEKWPVTWVNCLMRSIQNSLKTLSKCIARQL